VKALAYRQSALAPRSFIALLKFNLFYWIPEFVTARIFRDFFESRYAELAFARHAEAARDEFELLANELQSLSEQTTVKTPLFEKLRHNIAVPLNDTISS
jgi:hypothetical protein